MQENNQLFISDGFTHTPYAFYEDVYSNISIRGLSLSKSYKESEVFYLKLNDENIKGIIDGLYKDYSQLLGSAISSYKRSNGRKGILKIGTTFPQTDKSQEIIDDLMENKFKKYFNSDNAVLPLEEGLDYEESKVQSNIKDSRDVRAVVDDVIDFVAAAFHIPSGIIKGNVAPIAKLISSEINRKMYGKENFLKRTYVKVNTQKIRNVDLEKMSKSADLLFRIGVNSIDDNLELIGKEPINENWSKEHYVTKNYQSVVDIKNGGEKNGTKNSKLGN